MSSEEISTIAVNPFVCKFVFAIIQSIRVRNLSYEEKHVIHADLVPKVSKKVMQASLGERTTRGNMSGLVAPIPKPMFARPPIPPPVRQMPQVVQVAPSIQPVVLGGMWIDFYREGMEYSVLFQSRNSDHLAGAAVVLLCAVLSTPAHRCELLYNWICL